MTKKHILIGVLLATLLLAVVPALSIAAPQAEPVTQDQPNLLQNPGFEGITCRPGSKPPECLDNWTHDVHDGSFHDNIFTPQGWVTWWREGGDYGQPEVKTIPNVAPYNGELDRIRNGFYAVQLFNFFRLQDTGLYQCVSGLEPGATVEMRAYGQGWSCDDSEAKIGYTCGDPFNQTFQVGIEPNGIADPFAPSIVWSGETASPDKFRKIGPVSAQVGEGGKVCVFLRSKTKWMYRYQDAYWDDASLKVTAAGVPPTNTPPPPPPAPTAGPSPTPLPTPTPRPDGAIVHVVQAGDTLFGISLMYNVPLDQIRQLNASSLGGSDIIRVGQELVIGLPSKTPVPTPLPEPPTAVPEEGGGGDPAAPAGGGASVCVLAYHDRDTNQVRDAANEELLPNASFKIVDGAGTIVNQYISDGINEPYCFAGLAAGSYRIILDSAPPGYAPSGSAELVAAVAEGTIIDIQFGATRSTGAEDPAQADVATSEEGAEEGGSGGSSVGKIFSTVAKVSGVLVLLLAAGMAVLFVLNRRRM